MTAGCLLALWTVLLGVSIVFAITNAPLVVLRVVYAELGLIADKRALVFISPGLPERIDLAGPVVYELLFGAAFRALKLRTQA